jgi:phosphatidylglycerophosphate synthase
MFSVRARSRLLSSGIGPRSLLTFARDSWVHARAQARRNPVAARRLWRFGALAGAACTIALVPVYISEDRPGDLPVALGASYGAALVVTAWLVMHVDMLNAGKIGLANYLTLLRFLLIAPVTVLLVHGLYVAAIALYVLLSVTDVADGMVARRRDERSEFGVVMDPLADVFSTAALFAALTVRGLVPVWLLCLLLARYAMLIVGSYALFIVVGRFEIRATIPGKIVGVVQAACAIAIMVGAFAFSDEWARFSPVLFALLGLGFASIIVSQLVIGTRHLVRWRRKAHGKEVEVGSQG